MAVKTKPWLVLSFLLFAANCIQQCVHGESQVRCLFIFGDSLSDNGNNNLLLTSVRANFRPYGIDFPKGPTGRFTNGKNTIDFISEFLGFKPIPPHANIGGSDILKGVNYASGGAGIRPETGKHLGANFELEVQLTNHKDIYSRIANKLGGPEKAKEYLNKCLYYVNIGTNDYILNYFLSFYPTSRKFTREQYAQVLVDQYSVYLQKLHDLGARKFVLVGLGDVGCTPNAISTYRTNGSACVEMINNAVSMFNDKLKSLVDQLNNNYSADSKFIITRGIDKFTFFGFTVPNASCCRTLMNAMCIPLLTPCKNRTEYAFWDGYHSTEAVYKIVAIRSYNGSNPTFNYPINITRLVQS